MRMVKTNKSTSKKCQDKEENKKWLRKGWKNKKKRRSKIGKILKIDLN